MKHLWRILFVCSFVTAGLAHQAVGREKEHYCNWDSGITEARIDDADALLYDANDPRVHDAVDKNLPFGMPEETGDRHGEHLLAQDAYIVWYDDDLRSPLWVAEYLPKERAQDEHHRQDSFRSDPRLSEDQRSDCADYKEPIFDQGHLVPRADMNRSDAVMDDSFLMSNMTPQHCAFNRGPWEVLEVSAREWASEVDDTWVISGTVYDRDDTLGRDADANDWRMNGKLGRRVAIPSAQYKIIVQRDVGGFKTLSFLLPNNDMKVPKKYMKEYLSGHVTSLDTIAQESGFRFLQSETVHEAGALNKELSGRPLASGCRQSYPDK